MEWIQIIEDLDSTHNLNKNINNFSSKNIINIPLDKVGVLAGGIGLAKYVKTRISDGKKNESDNYE